MLNTAYERLISDWSSDVCSSDLHEDALMRLAQHRSLRSQVIEIGVRIVDEPVAAEEIVLVKILLLVVHGDSVVELLSAAVVRRGRFSRDVLPGIRQAPADVPAVHPRRKAGGRAGSINKQRCRPKLTSVADRKSTRLNSSH